MSDAAPPLPQAEDFRAECRTLHHLLANIKPDAWEWQSTFKRWTSIDIVGHLYMADHAAAIALNGPDAFTAFMAGFRAALDAGQSAAAYTRRWHGITDGPLLLERWRSFAEGLADQYRDLDPRGRIPWGRGPDMSARSCMSARQMETWAHGQALFDLFGTKRREADRIHNIAVLGINTYAWAFRNRSMVVPDPPPFVALTSPSGAVWQWHDPEADDRIVGSAVDFCKVVTQTRNVADTELAMSGPTAKAWMAIAQCFAGPPHAPPAPGLRTTMGRAA